MTREQQERARVLARHSAELDDLKTENSHALGIVDAHGVIDIHGEIARYFVNVYQRHYAMHRSLR